MKKSIKLYQLAYLLLLVFTSSACKKVTDIFSNDKASLPSNSEILKSLYTKISEKDFDIKILSKKIQSMSTIKVERENFFEGKSKKTLHKETCRGIQLRLAQKTKKKCSLSIKQAKNKRPFTHCLKTTDPSTRSCKKWVKPLFFASYCKKSFPKKTERKYTLLTIPKGHQFEALIRIEICKMKGKKAYSLRQFKADGEPPLLNAQRI